LRGIENGAIRLRPFKIEFFPVLWLFDGSGALSSAVEHFLHTEGVAGSNPAARTIIPQEIEGASKSRTDSAQNPAECAIPKVKFPKVIKHRRLQATIYGRGKKYPCCRLAYYTAG
jgi:hypothetical protein